MQDDEGKLKAGYKKLIKCTMLVSFFCMIGMAAVAEPLVRVLIGDKWLTCVPYLQLLCFVGMLYPLHALNLDMLNVKGRSDLFLRLEIIKQTLTIPTIIVGVFLGVKAMIVAMLCMSIIAYFLNSYWSGAMVGYPPKEQIMDILPSFVIAALMGAGVCFLGYLLPLRPIAVLLIQMATGCLFALAVSKIVRLDAYLEIRQLITERIRAVTAV